MIKQSKDIVLVTAADGAAGMYHNNALVVEGRSDMKVAEIVSTLRMPVEPGYSVGYVPFGRTFPNGFPATYAELFGAPSPSPSPSPSPTLDVTAQQATEPTLEQRIAQVKFTVPGLAKVEAALGVIANAATPTSAPLEVTAIEVVEDEDRPAYEDANGMPIIGEMIYVEGFNGVFADVEAGLSEIVNVYTLEPAANKHAIVEKNGELRLHVIKDEDEDEDEEVLAMDDDGEVYARGNSDKAVDFYTEVFIEVADLPGNLLNWKMLREEQDDLRERFANGVLRITTNYSNLSK